MDVASTKGSLSVIEKDPGVSPADFEAGDRFYCIDKNGILQLGVVLSSTPDKVSVRLDNGQYIQYEAQSGYSIEQCLASCGKPLDLSQLKVGSVLSATHGGIRHFLEVTRLTNTELLAMFTTPPHLTHLIRESETETLEHKLAYWELEA